MARFIGHGPLVDCNCSMTIQNNTPLNEIIEKLPVPQNYREIIIPVKGNAVIDLSDRIDNDDTIHLYIALSGG